jgi:hypothetical protein
MRATLHVSVFEPMHEVPERCTICAFKPPVFDYEWRPYGEEEPPETGFCCALCAVGLLKKLERAEARQWHEEEAALVADGFDVRDLQRRLAAFPKAEGR